MRIVLFAITAFGVISSSIIRLPRCSAAKSGASPRISAGRRRCTRGDRNVAGMSQRSSPKITWLPRPRLGSFKRGQVLKPFSYSVSLCLYVDDVGIRARTAGVIGSQSVIIIGVRGEPRDVVAQHVANI